MANIATNLFYINSGSKENVDFVLSKISEYFSNIFYTYQEDNSAELEFESTWNFPEEEMSGIFEDLPDKEDIYMRCLSYEFGTLYHSLWVCDKEGWHEV